MNRTYRYVSDGLETATQVMQCGQHQLDISTLTPIQRSELTKRINTLICEAAALSKRIDQVRDADKGKSTTRRGTRGKGRKVSA